MTRLALSVEEAAATVGISRDSFERYVLGKIRVVRVGRRIIVPVTELERFLARNALRPPVDELEALSRRVSVG